MINPEEMMRMQQGAQPIGQVPPQQAPQQPDPLEVLPTVVTHYLDHAVGVKSDQTLNAQVKAQILLQMAQAINYLVPLLTNDAQAEMELKREEHGMNMEMKQAELQFKQQEHEMKLQHSQAENQMKIQQTQQQNEMNIRHKEEAHQSNIVQSHQGHEQKMEQGKQAQQLKQSSKQGSKGDK